MKLNIQELVWDDIKAIVKEANPQLFDLVEEFNPDNNYSFILARYPYGAEILGKDEINLPTDTGSVIPLSHGLVPESIKNKLRYSPVPIGLIVKNSIEVHFQTQERLMCSRILNKGSLFGLWEMYDAHNKTAYDKELKSIWSLSAGSRSVFMLPKIGDIASHARLKRDFGISGYAPKDLLEHFTIFHELAVRAETDPDKRWSSDVIFFCEKWSKYEPLSLNSNRLHHYWLMLAWEQSLMCRKQMYDNTAWELFVDKAARKNLKLRPYIINTIQHLMAISNGVYPGFMPAKDDSIAPVKLIQDCYIHSYLLKNYLPIIMHPIPLQGVEKFAYYSMSFPSLLEWTPRSKVSGSVMSDIRELMMLINLFIKESQIKNLQYEYFHTDDDHLGEIKNAKSIPNDDPEMLQPLIYKDNLQFPENSSFFRGCIRIHKIDFT